MKSGRLRKRRLQGDATLIVNEDTLTMVKMHANQRPTGAKQLRRVQSAQRSAIRHWPRTAPIARLAYMSTFDLSNASLIRYSFTPNVPVK